MPFKKKLGSLALPIAATLILNLSTSMRGLAEQPARGDRTDNKQTVGPNKILESKASSPKAPPTVTTPPTTNQQQTKTPEKQPPPEEKKNPEPQKKPAQDDKKQSPFPESKDYSEEFEKDNLGKYYYGVGNCKCDGILDLQNTAVAETIEYYKTNQRCINGGATTQYMAVNDYRKSTGCMYIIDLQGKCVKAVDAAYGIGSSTNGDAPKPNCTNGSLGTPAGFHVTAPHTGGDGRYDTSNSLLMKDLQEQGSAGRGILIHAGSCSGGACSWGCTGVSTSGETSEQTLQEVKRLLPPGTLVYNYFGNQTCHQIRGKLVCINGHGSAGTGSTSQGTSSRRSQ